MPVSSLPSKYGIGCFSQEAYDFIDWLSDSGQTYWQILPLCPSGPGDSPYQSVSTFAGNPYFIDLDKLSEKGMLTKKECEKTDFGSDPENVDYGKLYQNRYKLLKKAFFQNEDIRKSDDFTEFEMENSYWLDDYALFMALKEKYPTGSWAQWDDGIKTRENSDLETFKETLSDEISYYKFLQYEFFSQWNSLKKYANDKGVKIIGDIPIYVAFDSADVWANPDLFKLDDNFMPTFVAGCPPDGFSADGQLWGNPVYEWKAHKNTGYDWWIKRLAHCFDLYDVVRIDHFRGFDEYYSIPFGAKNAKSGQWEKGPGAKLFKAVKKTLGKKDIIAEDLGFVTGSVKKLVKECGFPGMKVLQFAFDSRDTGSRNDYLPHNYGKNCVAYTGTHDNQTLKSWFDSITPQEQKEARDYLCDNFTPKDKIYKSFISLIMRSRADTVIIPMQDYLGLDDKSRMNTPSTVGNNWKWRIKKSDLSDKLKDEILHIAKLYGRMEEEK